MGTAGTGDITSKPDDYSIRLNIITFIVENKNLFPGLQILTFPEAQAAAAPASNTEVNLDYVVGGDGKTLGTVKIDTFDKVKLGFGLVSHMLGLKDEMTRSATLDDAIKGEDVGGEGKKIEPLGNLIKNIQLLADAFLST